MRGRRTVQFLVHKSLAQGGPWQADGLHERWEETEDWLLSDLSGGMESRDGGLQLVCPARGGAKEIWDGDTILSILTPNDLAQPALPCPSTHSALTSSRGSQSSVSETKSISLGCSIGGTPNVAGMPNVIFPGTQTSPLRSSRSGCMIRMQRILFQIRFT
ncbi:hypothetical protein BJX65DRAFT_107257 [Aspergillus insuetus]